MNLGKGLISIVLLGLASLAVGWSPMDGRSVSLLAASGVVGIAVGDTLFFAALVRLGPRLTVLLGMLGPVFAIGLAIGLLHERVAPLGGVGMGMTLLGVTLVLSAEPGDGAPRDAAGVTLAVLAALTMAVGVVLAKVGVASVSALQATLVRMLGSTGALGVLALTGGRLGAWLQPFRERPALSQLLVAVGVVVFGGFFLSLLSLKWIDASVACVLGATEPLLVLPVTAIALRQGIRPLEVAGAVLGFGGIALIAAT